MTSPTRTLKEWTDHSKRQPTQGATLILRSSEGVILQAQNESWAYLNDAWH
ncbi:MAG: hypothetical protein ACFFCZ_06745 [Promethearchaeota archaeon]